MFIVLRTGSFRRGGRSRNSTPHLPSREQNYRTGADTLFVITVARSAALEPSLKSMYCVTATYRRSNSCGLGVLLVVECDDVEIIFVPVRELWRKRYLEAKKVTPKLEEDCSKMRQELERLHRELLAKVQAGVAAILVASGRVEKPSNKLSYKIMIARLLQEIEDLRRRVEGTRLKLSAEIKLRIQAEKDVKSLREELLKKKIQVTLTRHQEQAVLGSSIREQYFISTV